MKTTTELTAQWVIDIIEEDRHRKELAQMIQELKDESLSITRKIIEKKPFK